MTISISTALHAAEAWISDALDFMDLYAPDDDTRERGHAVWKQVHDVALSLGQPGTVADALRAAQRLRSLVERRERLYHAWISGKDNQAAQDAVAVEIESIEQMIAAALVTAGEGKGDE